MLGRQAYPGSFSECAGSSYNFAYSITNFIMSLSNFMENLLGILIETVLNQNINLRRNGIFVQSFINMGCLCNYAHAVTSELQSNTK